MVRVAKDKGVPVVDEDLIKDKTYSFYLTTNGEGKMANNFSIAATASTIAAAAEPKVGRPAINRMTLLFMLMALAGLGAGLYPRRDFWGN